jgi:hypothetical protein
MSSAFVGLRVALDCQFSRKKGSNLEEEEEEEEEQHR